MECPCQSGVSFEKCCEPYLEGRAVPETAEKLMRSRYTAFTRVEIDYIRDTHDPKTRKDFDPKGTRTWAENSEWLGLEIVSTERGGPQDETGTVEFIARYSVKDQEQQHHEIAEFRKLDNRWYFTDGKIAGATTFVRAEEKIGRNDPCPCGSGKKYKKCCATAS
jgi:SEC-C motif domain protein